MNEVEAIVVAIAEVCHEANKAWCEANGDMSQVAWEISPEWQRNSAILGVQFHIDHPNSKPEDSHRSWCKQKVKDGWVYGKEKDPDKKTHPCLVLFDKLPEVQQKKDKLFLTIVRALL